MFDDRELRIWINEACRDIARRTDCLRDTDTVTAVASTQAYTMAADVLKIDRVEYVATGQSDRRALQYMDLNSMDKYWGTSQTQSTGTPQYWTSWGTPPALSLKLYPTPSLGGSIYVYHYRLPAELATNDTSAVNTSIDVPSGWEDVVLDYLEYRAFLKDGQPQRAQMAKQQYEQNLEAIWSQVARFTNHAGMVDAASPYFGPIDMDVW
jgi:hypothetical protein